MRRPSQASQLRSQKSCGLQARSRCDGAVRTSSATGCDARFAPVAAPNPGILRLSGRWVRTSVRRVRRVGSHPSGLKTPGILRLSGSPVRRVGANCEPGIAALSLAKYRAGPPRTRLSPGRTRNLSDLAEASARQRRFCSPSRPTDITSKPRLKVSESKTAHSRGWRGCETQSSRMIKSTPCDGHCQAF